MTDRIQFYVPGQPFDGGTYHYVASGLDNVYLLNGFTVEEDPDYGCLVTFHKPDMLHRAIAIGIIEGGKPLNAKEFKFLRRMMKLTQKTLASNFGVDTQTIANYEKGITQIPKTSSDVFKANYLLSILPEDVRASVIREIIRADKKKFSKCTQIERERAVKAWRESDGSHLLSGH